MKTSRLFALFIVVLACFLAARWGSAQPTDRPSGKKLRNDGFGSLEQLASFISYLQELKQTNAVQRFNVYVYSSIAAQQYADLGITLAVLERLRSGRTNEAYELLEGQLNSDVIGFVACYRALPNSLREQGSLNVLRAARDYRAKTPFKHRNPDVDQGEGVTEAFKILDEKAN